MKSVVGIFGCNVLLLVGRLFLLITDNEDLSVSRMSVNHKYQARKLNLTASLWDVLWDRADGHNKAGCNRLFHHQWVRKRWFCQVKRNRTKSRRGGPHCSNHDDNAVLVVPHECALAEVYQLMRLLFW